MWSHSVAYRGASLWGCDAVAVPSLPRPLVKLLATVEPWTLLVPRLSPSVCTSTMSDIWSRTSSAGYRRACLIELCWPVQHHICSQDHCAWSQLPTRPKRNHYVPPLGGVYLTFCRPLGPVPRVSFDTLKTPRRHEQQRPVIYPHISVSPRPSDRQDSTHRILRLNLGLDGPAELRRASLAHTMFRTTPLGHSSSRSENSTAYHNMLFFREEPTR
ncbi:hypothetical protein C2E23DRAFT_520624 [Lenzites betulinus]|nr:hypothetical protein C2E23DRAFT_520624 [Lenzites betulinus]